MHDFQTGGAGGPSITRYIEGEKTLDFLATIKFRLEKHKTAILASEHPVIEITHRNLLVQVEELAHELDYMARKGYDNLPIFIIGTLTYNHENDIDEESIEHFLVMDRAGGEFRDVFAIGK